MRRGQRLELNADHVHVGTWLDRAGESHSFFLRSSRIGWRILVHVWHDDRDPILLRVVDGDGCTPLFREFVVTTLPAGSTEETIRAAVDRLRESY